MSDKKIQLQNRAGDNLFPKVMMVDEPSSGEKSDYYLNGDGGWSQPPGGGAGTWSELTGKPFNTLNPTQFNVDQNERLNINTNQPNGLAQLGSDGKLAATYIPASFIQGTTVRLTAINTICILDKVTYDAMSPAEKLATTMYIIRG